MSDWAVQERLQMGLYKAEKEGASVDVILISEADIRALSDEDIARIRKRKESNAQIATFGKPFDLQETLDAQIERERQGTENFISGRSVMTFNGVRLLLARVDAPMYLSDLTHKG